MSEDDYSAPESKDAAPNLFAAALAMSGASRSEADAFLKNQNALTDIQKHHLHEQCKHLTAQLKHLQLGVWEKRLGVFLRIATGIVGLAVAGGLAFMLWDASRSNGLVIEAFSVPPDMTSRGVTGQAVAARLLDQLAGMEAQTRSSRAPRSYANNWAQNDLKIDIPETGISLQQLDRFVTEKLGHDIHITGEVMRTDAGLSLSARAGGAGAQRIDGAESDLDGLILKASEAVYRLTQPYRYGIYLAQNWRYDEAMALYRQMAQTAPMDERPWAYFGWGNLERERAGIETVLKLGRLAVAAGPDAFTPSFLVLTTETERSLPEDTLRDGKRMLLPLSGSKRGLIRDELIVGARAQTDAYINSVTGAFRDAAQSVTIAMNSSWITIAQGLPADMAKALAGAHELAAARAILSDPGLGNGVAVGYATLRNFHARMIVDSQAEDWTAVVADARLPDALVPKYPGLATYVPSMITPLLAKAEAKLGHAGRAEQLISHTQADCYDCLVARGEIAELQGQHARADLWFTRAKTADPSIPFADSAWGQALLARGQPDAAIEEFKLSSRKGPRFADPLEGWGEALMARSQSHLALAKFQEADKYAPNWGRLHLKWGEALAYAGKHGEARAQFARAAQLDLTPSEKSELGRFTHV